MGLIACQGGKREGENGALPPLPNALFLGACWDSCLSPNFWMNCPHTGSGGPFFLFTQEGQVACSTRWNIKAAELPQRHLYKVASSEKEQIFMAASPQTVPFLAVASLGGPGMGAVANMGLGTWDSIQLARTTPLIQASAPREGQLPKQWLQVPAL